MAYFKNHRFVKTVKIDLSESFGEGTFIVLREPTTDEAFKLRADDEVEAVKIFKELIPSLIMEHNFYEAEEGEKLLPNTEVTDIIYDAFGAFQNILKEYSDSMFQSK